MTLWLLLTTCTPTTTSIRYQYYLPSCCVHQGELMTPSASRDGSYDALTRLTLALMEDSGW